MITFGYDCPHCKTQNVAFTVTGCKVSNFSDSKSLISIMANCNKCKLGIITNIVDYPDFTRTVRQYITSSNSNDLQDLIDVNTLNFYPEPEKISIPKNLPSDVESELKTAEKLYLYNNDDNNFIKPAGNAYRSVLEKSLCHLAENDNRARLNKRIEKLYEEGKLTIDLKNFAMHIRSLSSEASHAYNDFTLEELVELRLFINLFLQYTFTLPAMIPSMGDNE